MASKKKAAKKNTKKAPKKKAAKKPAKKTQRCKVCGQEGHNRRYHETP